MYSIYQVQSGDTLASVASKFGSSISDLSRLNGIMVGSILVPGEYIVVPKRQMENPYFVNYVVKKGDNIYEIARKYNIEPEQLLKLNGLNANDIIYPNQEILIPSPNVKVYVTSEGDTLNKVIKELETTAGNIQKQNETIYLLPDQLISVKKN